jgi:hypothetical protein
MNNSFEFIDEPLLTDEGFVNPVYLAQLESAIMNMPNIYERTSGDPEWETKHYIYWRQITGGLAHWAIRNISTLDDTPFPPKLESVIGFLSTCIRPKFDKEGCTQLSLRDVAKLLYDTLMPEKIFLDWNDAKILPGWLDLDALVCGVCVGIRNEWRTNAEFDRKFEAEYSKLTETDGSLNE